MKTLIDNDRYLVLQYEEFDYEIEGQLKINNTERLLWKTKYLKNNVVGYFTVSKELLDSSNYMNKIIFMEMDDITMKMQKGGKK